MRKDKENSIKKKIEEVQKDHNNEWKEAKYILGWQIARTSSILAVLGKTLTKSHKIADAINVAIINKTNRIKRNIPRTDMDPIVNYSKLMDGKMARFSLQNMHNATTKSS